MGIPAVLCRNTQLAFAKTAVEEGEIIFRPLSFYQGIEDEIRRDLGEGAVNRSIEGWHIELIDEISGAGTHRLQVTTGTLRVHLNSSDRIFISCFSLAPQPKFGDTTIEISDARLFLRTLKAFLKAVQIEMLCGLVEYYDQKSVDLEYAQKRPGLMKDRAFSDEIEFRILIVLSEDHQFWTKLREWPLPHRVLKFQSKSLAKFLSLQL
jgi:hypothetical protein